MYTALLDHLDRMVDHVITWSEFSSIWLHIPAFIERCHDFEEDGFLYDEAGVYGLSNTTVGFKTKMDVEKYRQWLKDKT